MAEYRIGQLGGILGRYANFDMARSSTSLDVDFEMALEMAPRKALEIGLAVTFHTQRAPFAETVALMYERADRSVRAALLNKIFAVVPDLQETLLVAVIPTGRRITPKVTDLIPPTRVMEIASTAASMDSTVIDTVSAYSSRQPSMLLQLDSASRTAFLTSLARAETRGDTPRISKGATRAMRDSDETSVSRQIVVTGHGPSGRLVTSFEPRSSYALRLRVSGRTEGNLARGQVDVTDVPETGLAARWVVASNNVDILAVSHNGSITTRGETALAEFELLIPGLGDSETVTLQVRTRDARGELTVTLFVGGETYRTLTVELEAGARVKDDRVCTAAAHLDLETTHEWATPEEHILVSVLGQSATVSTIQGPNNYGTKDWLANSAALKNPIQRVRAALEKFWVVAVKHLNDIDTTDMAARLQTESWKPYHWAYLSSDADPGHSQAHATLASGTELRALATEGYALWEACFPRDSELRGIIEKLEPGSRVDFRWTIRGNQDWVSHVPWALMYLDPLKSSDAVNCERFLGLRYRIGSTAWEPRVPSRALGDHTVVNTLNFLYWGNGPRDEVGAESIWQRNEFAKWPRQNFVPDPLLTIDPKKQIITALESPEPDPAAILYLYCHCTVKDGSEPSLQFGETGKTPDVVEASDIYQGRLPSAPLVFANACTTVTADPQGTSELERRFFTRDIRAFLGTETKVPPVLASRFAWLFFQFFLRRADPEPMPAGEALAQARMFLWTQYRNPGGLLYCLVNEYDLYLASDDEVRRLSRLRK